MSNPTYMGSANPDPSRYADYYPAWLDNLAEDVTIEGSLLDGAAQGPDAVRTIVGAIRRQLSATQLAAAHVPPPTHSAGKAQRHPVRRRDPDQRRFAWKRPLIVVAPGSVRGHRFGSAP